MRITEGMRRDSVGRSLGSLASRQAEAARRATTGERVGAPSADPASAAELVRIAAAEQRTQAFRKSVAAVRSEAELAEGALGEAGDLFQRARELALQGANGGLSASDRASIAGEIALLRRHLVSLGNTRGPNGFVFGGTKVDAAPFDATGTFTGNDDAHSVDLGPGVAVRANASGAGAFTVAGGVDAFAALGAVETALLANDAAGAAASLAGLDAAREQIEGERSAAGLLLDRLGMSDTALELSEILLAGRGSAIGEADPVEALSELRSLTQTLEQALSVARTFLTTGSGSRF